MTDERFPLPGSSYPIVVKIVQAYGGLRAPSGPQEVGRLIGTDPTTVSRNNKFLVAVGLVEGADKKGPTEAGRRLARALDHDMATEIVAGWQDVLAGNEFVTKLLSAVRIRKGMDRSSLQTHVAFTAGQPRKAPAMKGAGTVIDVLLAAEMLRDIDGKLIVTAIGHEGTPSRVEATLPATQDVADSGTAPPTASPTPQPGVQGVPVQIQIQIQVAAKELDDLAPRLRRILEELNGGSPQSEN